jgi:hypothetical protein
MRSSLVFIFSLVIIIACKKNQTSTGELRGVWVESTQRLDTIYFDGALFGSNLTFELRSEVQTYNSIYDYRVKPDSMLLRSFFSSYNGFYSYYYRRENRSSFTIRNFYHPSLSSTLRFERIK